MTEPTMLVHFRSRAHCRGNWPVLWISPVNEINHYYRCWRVMLALSLRQNKTSGCAKKRPRGQQVDPDPPPQFSRPKNYKVVVIVINLSKSPFMKILVSVVGLELSRKIFTGRILNWRTKDLTTRHKSSQVVTTVFRVKRSLFLKGTACVLNISLGRSLMAKCLIKKKPYVTSAYFSSSFSLWRARVCTLLIIWPRQRIIIRLYLGRIRFNWF